MVRVSIRTRINRMKTDQDETSIDTLDPGSGQIEVHYGRDDLARLHGLILVILG